VHHIWKWREVPTWCTNLFIVLNNCTCFGHLYAHLQEYISRIQTYTQCTILHTDSSGPQPQHLVVNTICSNTQLMYSWRWAYRCPKHVELFKIINKFLHQVGTSDHFHIWCTDTHTSNKKINLCGVIYVYMKLIVRKEHQDVNDQHWMSIWETFYSEDKTITV
jgi:hypothetical protein